MYCKAMKRWLSGMLLFALVLAFGAPASANLLYTAQTNYSNTTLGKIVGSTVTSNLGTNIGGNWGQGIFPFRDAQNQNRVAVALYQGGADTIKILDPTSISWNSTAPIGNTSLSNIRKMVSLNGFLYGISYGNNPYGGQPSDVAQVRRFDMNNSYASGTASFSYNPSTGQGHGEGLVAYNNYLYAILTETRGSYPFTYAPNKLIKLNSTNLSVAGYPVNLSGKNTDGGTHGAYCQNGATLYLTSWGGSQPTDTNYNSESQVERVNLGNLSHSTLVTGRQMRARDATWNHHFTAVAIKGQDAYIQATTWSRLPDTGGSGGQVRLYRKGVASIGSLGPGDIVKSLDTGGGWRVGMIVDEDYLYVAAGKKLYRYTLPVTASSVATVFGPGSTSLGGDISSFAAVPSLRGASAAQAAMDEPIQAMAAGDDKEGGSGCDAGFGWLLLLAVVPVALRRRG